MGMPWVRCETSTGEEYIFRVEKCEENQLRKLEQEFGAENCECMSDEELREYHEKHRREIREWLTWAMSGKSS